MHLLTHAGLRWRRRTGQRPVGRLALVALSLVLAACTTLPTTPLVRDEEGCHDWMARLETAIAAAGVGDAEAEPIAGFPGLRVDRVAAALRGAAASNEPAFVAWLDRAAALDRAARSAEIANLPDAVFPLGSVVDRGQALARTDACRANVQRQLRAAPVASSDNRDAATTEASASLRNTLLDRATVPERYSTASRALGLYPLLRWPFFAGVEGWQRAQAADMARWATAPPPLVAHAPPAGPPSPAASPAASPVAPTAAPPWPPALDALGLPQPAPEEAQHLLAWHAPVFEIEVRGAFDRFGVPQWTSGDRPEVDTQRPVVYQRIAHMRLQGRWHLQLVYTLWFPERPPRSSLDLLAGALDGVIVRLTLGDDGQPLLMDTIHACGCYHMFFPATSLHARPGAPTSEEWMFAPAALPALTASQRLAVRIASASHYVNGVGAVPRHAANAAPGDPQRYELRDEQQLRSLPRAPSSAGRRSLYGPDGLVAGTERGERFLFWPMGIASAGAMRQWGHHATAFVGRRHFDEPDLIEQRFELRPR